MKSNEQKTYMWFQGREKVEVLCYSMIRKEPWADVRFADGRRHTVPADELYDHQCEVNHDA